MAASKARCAEACLGVEHAWDIAMRLCLLHELLKNSLAPDLRRCRRACGIPATKKRKHGILQDMLHHAQDVQMHQVMLTQLTSSMTVEALKQWVSTMRMMGFTVPSAKTMAQSRANIVKAIIDCDQPSKSAPANIEGQVGVVNPGRPGTASALRLGQSQASKPVASSSMEYAPAADTVWGSELAAYDAGAAATHTRRKMHKRWSKLALRASLPKRIRRALVSVRDSHADSTVAAVRGVVATKIGVPLDGKYMWVFDKVCLKLFAAPQKKRRPRNRFVLKVSRQQPKQLSEQ